MSYESELRRTADEFLMTVAVVADERGVDPKVLALQSITDASARLNEVGALGPDAE